MRRKEGPRLALRRLLVLGLLLITGPACHGSDAQGIVRVIATGNAQCMPYVRGWIMTEPSVDGIIIPTRESDTVNADEIVRLMRIYFPRTFDDLVSYNFLILAQVDMCFVNPSQAQWMHDAIKVHGLGGVNTRSVMSALRQYSQPWAESILSDAFPNEVFSVINSPYYLWPSGRLVANDDPNLAPVLQPFKSQIEEMFPSYAGLYTAPRAGSRIHSWLKTNIMNTGFPDPGYIPHVFEWNYGKGITFTLMDMVYDNFWRTNINPFALDIIVNIVWYGSHRRLPDDPYQVHVLRESLQYFHSQKSAVLSVFDFSELFGANAAGLYEELGDLDQMKSEADLLYLQAEFDACYDEMSGIITSLNQIAERALKLKDQALLWVYLVEWLTVAATSMVCGTVLWFLMVRRQLYREVGVTRHDDGSTQ